MPLNKHLPSREQVRNIRMLQFLGEVLFQPNLWHMNRHSVSYAVLVGAFCCFLPIPFQMLPAVLAAILLRCNLPLVLAIVWISNPITMAPMMYFAYRIGAALLGEPATATEFELSVDGLLDQLEMIWQPLLLGCFATGTALGLAGFIAVRLYYRWKIQRYWRQRRRRNRIGESSG